MLTTVVVAALIALSLPAAAQPQQTVAQQSKGCKGTPFEVPQKSFKQLATSGAYVWVDDIRTTVFSGYSPFRIEVVIGTAYPPFHADAGKLESKAFESLMSRAYGVKRTATTVSREAIGRGLEVPFTTGRQNFRLRVDAVKSSMAGEDKIVLKLCQ